MLSFAGNNNPGRLDRRVILQYKEATRDVMGGEVITWTNAVTVWAAKVTLGGGRMFAADGKNFDSSLQYRIRHRTDVKAGWRLVHADDTFEITFVDPGEARNRYLTLSLRGVNQTLAYANRSSGDRLVTDDGSVLVTDTGDTLVTS